MRAYEPLFKLDDLRLGSLAIQLEIRTFAASDDFLGERDERLRGTYAFKT